MNRIRVRLISISCVKIFGAKYAYTVDGGEEGEIEAALKK
jgi:di/tripeptidase